MSRRKPSTNEAAASPQVELGGYLGLLPIDVLTGIILNASSLTWVSLRGTCKALRQLVSGAGAKPLGGGWWALSQAFSMGTSPCLGSQVDEHVTTLSLRLPGLPRAGHQPGLEQSLHVPEWWKQPVNSNALDSVWEDGDEQCQVSAKALAQHLAGCSALHPKKLVIYGEALLELVAATGCALAAPAAMNNNQTCFSSIKHEQPPLPGAQKLHVVLVAA
jgi:hypothetical protein